MFKHQETHHDHAANRFCLCGGGTFFNGGGRAGGGQGFTLVDVPGAIGTAVTGTDGNSIVGFYEDSPGVVHPFVEQHGVFTTLTVPWQHAISSSAMGVSGDMVVGNYELPAKRVEPNGGVDMYTMV